MCGYCVVRSLGQQGLLEKEMATHSSILAWEIPRTEEPGGLQSMGSQKIWIQLSDQTATTTFTGVHDFCCCSLVTKSCPTLRQLFPFPGGLLGPGIEPKSPALARSFFTAETPGKPFTAATAAAKSLQSCPTLCDRVDGSPPGSPSLGVSRQEHWSGLPFPSPLHGSEK